MKKIAFLIVLMWAVIGLAFAAPSGSVSSATSIDASGEGTLGESVTLALTLGAVSMNAGVVLTDIGLDAEVDLTGDIAVAFGDAVSVKVASSYGIDSDEMIPLTITGDLQILPSLALCLVYANDNLNAEAVAPGTITATGTWSF